MKIVKRKKLLFIVTQSEMGGAQRYVFEVARNLDKEQYEVLVAAGEGDGELFEKIRSTKSEIRNINLKQMKRAPRPWQMVLAIKEIYNLLKKEKLDILFLCSTTAGLLGSLAGFLYKIFGGPTSRNSNYGEVGPRVIYRIGGWAFKDPRAFWKNWLVLLAEKLTAPLKDLIIVNSEVDRKLALKYKIVPERKLIKIYNGIDAKSLNFLPKEDARKRLTPDVSPLTSGVVLVGCVANFYKTKGLEYLIEAFRCLAPGGKQVELVVIGEGRERKKLEKLIKKYRLENKVILAGRIPDAYRYLKAFDVFVLSSLKEGFPWIILEAVAAEVPIVATRVGAIPEILNEEFLVEPGNGEALAKKISRLLEHPTKVELKPEFTLPEMIAETEKVLSSYNLI